MFSNLPLAVALTLAIANCDPIPAFAQAPPATGQHTWVASFGDDASTTCSRSSPCRRFDSAFAKTAAGGEISCVDSAPFGGLTINKTITINCANSEGSGASTTSTTASLAPYTINTSTADRVILRGLSFDASGTPAGQPITFIGAGTLILERVRITNAGVTGSSGLGFFPSGPAKLTVTDSLIANNGGNNRGAGILVQPQSAGSARVSLDRVTITGNAFGIAFDGVQSTGGINATINDSTMSGNDLDGIVATTPDGGAPIGVFVTNSRSLNNAFGVRSIGNNVTVRVKNSDIIGNTTGLSFGGGGALLTGGGNAIQANASNGVFSGSYGLQ